MSLMVSAKAKARSMGNPKDRLMSTAASETSSSKWRMEVDSSLWRRDLSLDRLFAFDSTGVDLRKRERSSSSSGKEMGGVGWRGRMCGAK
ncbi:hypothetical protein L1887_23478 [Cichorium endivia]|nr:hypothetical protein L1887_23478 [Cichorium endivia]